ncbi:MAG: AMP-binding protein [Firmicutes bacterium]|nr:AMP-binding protein [Bacillota bacterium]
MTADRLWLKNYTIRYNLDYPLVSLYEYLEQNIKKLDATALIFLGKEITYRELLENINKIATAIADRGLKKGDRIALMMPNCPEFVYTYYAAMRLGVVVTQVNPLYTPRELEFLIKDSESKLLFAVDAVYPTIRQAKDRGALQEIIISRLKGTEVDGEIIWYHDLLEKYEASPPAVQISPKEDVAVFQYTGGTTGFPKGAMLTHFNLVANCTQVKEHLSQWREKNGDKQVYSIGVLPFFHSYGMTCSLNTGLSANDTIIVLPLFDIEMLLNAIKQYRPSLFPAVPTIYNAIANHPEADKYNVNCIEVCNSGAAPMPLELQNLFQERTGAKLLEGYGLSEASPVTHSNPYNGVRKVGSVGLPFPDTDCKIVDLTTGTKVMPIGEEGELIISGPQVMLGYWNRPEETDNSLRDGWLYTGDIAKMDEDGYFYITDHDLLEKYEASPPAVQISPKEDVAVFQYTGGTTGFPKGAMLTHFNLVANCTQVKEHLSQWREKNGDKQVYSIGVLPFFHSYGMTCSLNTGLSANDTIIVLPLFDIEMLLNAIKQYRPSLFPAVPTIYNAIANHPEADKYNVNCIEVCNSGAAPMPLELQNLFQERTGAKLLEGYGLSEASPVTHSNPYNGVRKVGSVGLPFPDTDCKIVDLTTGTKVMPIGEEGELIISGPQVMLGYWNRPEETDNSLRDGWLYTGDIAKMDEDGYFYITDRKKDMIISGGYNIYPREVDEVLFAYPSVLDATTIGVPHLHYGEVVKAFVVLRQGMAATAEEIIDFCKERLVRYKVPREIEFRAELPKSNVGKILRRVLKDEEKQKRSAGGL